MSQAGQETLAKRGAKQERPEKKGLNRYQFLVALAMLGGAGLAAWLGLKGGQSGESEKAGGAGDPRAEAVLTPEQIEEILPQGGATATSEPTVTQETTATPDVLNMPIEQVVEQFIDGQIDYPTQFDNERRREFAVELAEYLNENVVADQAFVSLHFPEIGDTQAGWSSELGGWKSTHNSAESIDLSGDTLPPLVIPGMTNTSGQEVFIDPETGQETVLEKFDLPGLGEISLTELYAMGQNQLRDYSMGLMLDAMPEDDTLTDYVASARNNHFFLPVVIYRNLNENPQIYHTSGIATADTIEVPEAKVTFFDRPTNHVLMPLMDPESGQVLFWMSIQQGTQSSKTIDFEFSPGEYPNWNYTSTRVSLSRGEDQLFGTRDDHFFAIIPHGNTTEIAYDIHGARPLLEGGGFGDGEPEGIADAADILSLLETSSLEESLDWLEEFRLAVLYPDKIIYQVQP